MNHISVSESYSEDLDPYESPVQIEFYNQEEDFRIPQGFENYTLDSIEPLAFLILNDPRIFDYLRQKTLNLTKRSKMKKTENYLTLFFQGKGKPKIEYFRICIIRLCKKMIRIIIFKSISSFKFGLSTENKEQVKAYNIIEEICLKYGNKLKSFSCTVNGPQTEGKNTKKRYYYDEKYISDIQSSNYDIFYTSESNIKAKTYNNSYLYSIFQDPIIRGVYKAFIDYLFEFDLELLIEIFNFSCCKLKTHNSQCHEKWKKLKKFSQSTLVGCEFVGS